MTAAEIIEQIKALAPGEQAEVSKFVMENAHKWLPDVFDEELEHSEPGSLEELDIPAADPHPPA